MNKFLRYSLVAVLALVSNFTFAQEVTFDFNKDGLSYFEGITDVSTNDTTAGDITEAKSTTIDGFTLAVSPASGNTVNRLWGTSNGPQLRIYDGTITISSKTVFSQVTFNTGTFNAPTSNIEGKFVKNTWAAKKVAKSVTFAFSKTAQINSITVNTELTVDTTTKVVETVGKGTFESPYTVGDVLVLDEAGATPTSEVYVAGIVNSDKIKYTEKYGQLDYYIVDKAGNTDKVMVYNGLGVDKAKFESTTDLKEGDKVVVYGKLKNYKGTMELDRGNYLVTLNTTVSGINEIKNVATNNAVVYNLAGQKVSKNFKGVVIVNGKKYIQK